MHLSASFLVLASAIALARAQLIPNEYIVVYKSEVTELTTSTHETWLKTYATNINGSRVDGDSFRGYPELPPFRNFRYIQKYNTTGIRGYAAAITSAMAEEISQLPEVSFIEQNKVFRARSVQPTGAPWGLRRISTANLPLPTAYDYPTSAGAGVNVYVLDTGIRATHTEFEGRASYGRTFISGETDVDGNGHGTHVAGTIAGVTYGVAKKANIVGVKVLSASGSGSTSGIVSALGWVRDTAIASRKPCVINMSLGGGASSALDLAVNDVSTSAKCLVVVAAGNDAQDACNDSPGRALWAYTIGATQINDAIATFSNWGTCVNINAPGVGTLSSWHTSDSATETISGTSMACPHVAGAAAVAYSFHNFPGPGEAMNYITSLTVSGVITGLTGSKAQTPNRLLQLPAEFPTPSPSPVPVAPSPSPSPSSTIQYPCPGFPQPTSSPSPSPSPVVPPPASTCRCV